MPATIPQPARAPILTSRPVQGQVLYWCAPTDAVLPSGLQIKNGLVTAAYASVDDLMTISVGEDQTFDYSPNTKQTWLRVAAAKINEYLGQRFQVPLTAWSDTVVWANCELAYVGITRRRGINVEALNEDFKTREEAVTSWLKMARDHEVTPDQRLSTQDQPQQALRYIGPPSRGWDAGGCLAGLSNPYAGPGSIGRFRGRY